MKLKSEFYIEKLELSLSTMCQMQTSGFIFESLNTDNEVFLLIQLALKEGIAFNRLKLLVSNQHTGIIAMALQTSRVTETYVTIGNKWLSKQTTVI